MFRMVNKIVSGQENNSVGMTSIISLNTCHDSELAQAAFYSIRKQDSRLKNLNFDSE